MLIAICFFILCFGATLSRFTSTFQSRSSNIKSGTIKLVASKDVYTGGKIKNIYPGWSSENKITVKNEGTLPLKYEIGTEVIDNGTLYSGKHPFKVSINNKTFCDIDKIGRVYMGVLEPGHDDTLNIKLKLPEEADNECMGKECSFNFVFYSFQDNVALESEKNKDDIPSLKIIVDKNLTDNELKDGKHFLSIEKALQNAPEEAVILIEKGEYIPDGGILNIKKNVTLSGKCKNSNDVIINGKINVCSCKKYDNLISIENMTVQNTGNNKGTCYGIVLDNARNIKISNVCCTNNYNGINIKGICSNVKMNNCNFVSNKNFGLNLERGSVITDFLIDSCTFEKNSTGIYCEGICSGLNMKDCLINDNKNRGLYFEDIRGSLICGTEIEKNNISRTGDYKGIEVCVKNGKVKDTVFDHVNISCDKKINPASADISGIKIWFWNDFDKTKIKNVRFTDCSIKNLKKSLDMPDMNEISDDMIKFENLNLE